MTYKIYDNDNNRSDSDRLIGEGTFCKKDGVKCLLPNSEDITVVVDGMRMTTESKPAVMLLSENIENNEPKVVEMQWAYWDGKEYVDVSNNISRNNTDLSVIGKTKNYKDGGYNKNNLETG